MEKEQFSLFVFVHKQEQSPNCRNLFARNLSMNEKILIVDDEPDILQTLGRIFKREGYDIYTAGSEEEALKVLEETVFDLIISDMAMEENFSGIELLKILRTMDSITPFIIITGVGTIESAVEAIQKGAFHYITKPIKNQDIIILVQRAIEYGKLNRKVRKIVLLNADEERKKMFIGAGKKMQEILECIEQISDSMATVLITGETGTGKSLLAEKIHNLSPRRDKPFLTIDFASLTETILESELFGHVKGSFTGAIHAKRGLLEEGQGGTVFLDEISEMSPGTQVKLLRVVQEGLIKPVGGNKTVKIDVRFISASSKDIQKGVLNGEFRKELYYRLAVVPLALPPLRERREDIPSLVDYFTEIFCKKYKKRINHIDSNVLEFLLEAPLNGNIRELSNIIERAVLLLKNETMTMDCFLHIADLKNYRGFGTDNKSPIMSLKHAVQKTEKSTILRALEASNYNRSEAARILEISRRVLYDKMEAYSITLPRFSGHTD
jgi:DNA-binding NtrC family response regulator